MRGLRELGIFDVEDEPVEWREKKSIVELLATCGKIDNCGALCHWEIIHLMMRDVEDA